MHFSSLLAALTACPLLVSSFVHLNIPGHPAADGELFVKKATPPTQDPFYKSPVGFAKAAPGDILRHRPVPNPLLVGPAFDTGNVKLALQILYRTTNGLGAPSTAVQTLIVPHKADPSKLLSYQTFYDSPSDNCSPSFTLQSGQKNQNTEGIVMSSVLAQGWYLAVPDYEGLDAAFTVGKQAGQATLDGIRAVLNSKSLSGIAADPQVAMFGYSGGALASEWAAELQPTYAPDLKILAIAMGGLTPNVTSVILTINNTPNSNLIPKGTLGFANQYKNITAFLKKSLIPSKSAEFHLPLKNCNAEKLSNQDIFSFFKQGVAVLQDPIMKQSVSQNGIMGKTNTPTIPLYIFKAVGDEVSPVADTDALVTKYCAHGASIRYVRNHFGDHETEFIVGLPHALRWLIQRFDGVKSPKSCSTRNENVTMLAPAAKKILGATVFEELSIALSGM